MCFNHVCHKRRKIARICLYKLFASTKMSSATSASDSPPFSSYAWDVIDGINLWLGLILAFPFPNPCIDFAVCLCCVVSHPRWRHIDSLHFRLHKPAWHFWKNCFCERRVFGLVLCNFSFITNLSSENLQNSHPMTKTELFQHWRPVLSWRVVSFQKNMGKCEPVGKYQSLSEILPLNRAFSRRLCVLNQISHPSTYFFISPGGNVET